MPWLRPRSCSDKARHRYFCRGHQAQGYRRVGGFAGGAAMLSHRSKAPIVPVAIKRERRHIHVSFAPPIVAASVVGSNEEVSRKAIYSRINEAISDALTLMLGRSYAT